MKGGGNHASGASSAEDGLVIDLSNLNDVSVYKTRGQVTGSGGCRWGDVYSTLHKHGLICGGGGVHIVGVGGHLTRVNSTPPLSASLALIDFNSSWMGPTDRASMEWAATMYWSSTAVLADGQIATASESENPDLFWAIKGVVPQGSTYDLLESPERAGRRAHRRDLATHVSTK